MFKQISVAMDDSGTVVFATVDASGRAMYCHQRDHEWSLLPPHPGTVEGPSMFDQMDPKVPPDKQAERKK